MNEAENNDPVVDEKTEVTWVKPEITSFSPVAAAEGISYRPLDGIYNLTA
mgnify:CR=1 FL=1